METVLSLAFWAAVLALVAWGVRCDRRKRAGRPPTPDSEIDDRLWW